MIALDTNILARFLTRDDERQSQLVLTRLEQSEQEKTTLFVSTLVVLELIWVLGSAYRVPRTDIINAIDQLTQMSVLRFESPLIIQEFIQQSHQTTSDLSDILIAQTSLHNGAAHILTFDKKAAKLPYFTLLTP